MVSFLAFSSAFALLPLASWGVIVEDFQALPATEYDFVIVGGGAAGCAVANRLSEDPLHNILLLEAGPNNDGILDMMVPAYWARLTGTQYDWNYKTIGESGLNYRVDTVARGYTLGGSTSINGMVYTRGSSDDYNRWANLTGDEGWSWNRLLPYFLKSEKWTSPADNHDTTGDYDPSFHSTEGVVDVSLPGYPQAITETLREAAEEIGLRYDQDVNDGAPLGVAWQPSTIGNGTRSSSATAYLAPNYVSRPNLHVVVDHRVTRLLVTNQSGRSVPEFRTVVFGRNNSTTSLNVTATKEIILSAGSYGTPQLLLLSGIGSSQELEDVGVETIVDLPSVGKNLTEHVRLGMQWNVTGREVVDVSNNQTYQQEILEQWQSNRTGPLTSSISLLTWSRLPDDWPGWEVHEDPSAGSNTPHLEIISTSVGGVYPLSGPTIATTFFLLTPTSRGTVSLNTSDPLNPPLIHFGMLQSAFDIIATRQGVLEMKKLLTAPAWADWGLVPTGPLAEATSDEELEQAIRNLAMNGFHPVGTAMMTSEDASYGVVNPDLRVKKVSGLRVVDASIMPRIPAAHTQAPVYAIAERAADIIKAYWAENA